MVNDIRAAIRELVSRFTFHPCAECGCRPHGSVQVNYHNPLDPGDWEGLLPLCDDCFNDYLDQTRIDHAARD